MFILLSLCQGKNTTQKGEFRDQSISLQLSMSHPHQRTGAMSLHDGSHQKGVTPRTSTSPSTVEQYLRGGSASEGPRWSPTTSPTLGKDHDLEDDHGMHHKKSVLAKVKEKAKKWRHSLSKKKHSEDGNSTPSWGVSLEDDEEEADAEYLGAPMYESEMAPQELKETARQHPRAIPVISEKHVLPGSINAEDNFADEKTALPGKVATKPEAATKRSPSQRSPKTITETMTEKLAPAYATVTDATYAIASKIQSLAVSAAPEPSSAPAAKNDLSMKDKPTSPSSAPASVALKKNSPISAEPAARLAPVQAPTGSVAPTAVASAPTGMASPSEQMWDKGVSVKEYILNKLEPGEDERALSQVISHAISPKKTPGDGGVIEKVKGVVTSFLHNEDSHPAATTTTINESSASRVTLSTTDHEVVEENQGRRLQTN